MTPSRGSGRTHRRQGWQRALYLPGHLVKRFWWAVTARPLDPTTRAWVESVLQAGELALFDRMDRADHRHHVQVARRFVRRAGGDVPRGWLAAALLHDVGKLVCDLGTLARVAATLLPFLNHGDGAIARYYRHEAIGASLLQVAGSEPVTVALVGHWPEAPKLAMEALLFADDL